MNSLEIKLRKMILDEVKGDLSTCTPGLRLQVLQGGRLRADLSMGQTYRYYDLASLTKIIFTVPALMRLVDEGRLRVQDPVRKHLPWWPHKKTTVAQILSHSAGLPWWSPFYKKMNLRNSLDERRERLRKILFRTKLQSSKKAVYSDVDFILLGFILESIHGCSLIEIWASLPWAKRSRTLHFNVGNRSQFKKRFYAPTERCPWRKKVLRGEVHDENTWSFGGVSSHAGLFGGIEDVTRYGLLLRNSLRKNSPRAYASRKTVKQFIRRAVPPRRGDWALGFMLPTRGGASCGRYFHPTSIGHTGFTGTSLWYDPKRDLLVVLLSNRVHPTRANRKFVSLRPRLHDIVVEALCGGNKKVVTLSGGNKKTATLSGRRK